MVRAHKGLRQARLLRGVPQAAISALDSVAVRRSYHAGDIISYEGDPARAAHFLESGQVRVYRTALSGREQVLAVFGAGQAVNLAPVFQAEASYRSSVQALTDVDLYIVQRDELLAAVRKSPELALALLRHLADRLEVLADLVEDLSLRSVRGRLARFLLRNATGQSVPRRWTQDEMASQLGTVRDVVGRSLRALEDHGLVRVDRHRIVLVDREGLQAAAEA